MSLSNDKRDNFNQSTFVNEPDDHNNFTTHHKHRNNRGISWFVTALFLVGETAGSGLMTMPSAMINASL